MPTPQNYKDSFRYCPPWPEIGKNGVTASGFGNPKGNAPCFCTQHKQCYIYIPHSLTTDATKARDIFQQIMPTIENIWENPGDRNVVVRLDGKETTLFLEFGFAHILVQIQYTKLFNQLFGLPIS